MLKRRPLPFFFAFSLLIFAAVVLSAANDATTTADSSGATLPPLTIVATRVPRAADRLPTNVAVITRQQIAGMHARSALDLLRQVPGLNLAGEGGKLQHFPVSVRGTQPSTNGMLILVDGVEMTSPRRWVSVLNLPVENIERIEVLKSPASALYGVSGSSGIINIVTRSPAKGTSEGRLTLGGGSFGTLDNSLYAGIQTNNGLRLQLNTHWLNSNGFRENNDLRARQIAPRISWQNERLALSLLVNRTESHYEYPRGLPFPNWADEPENSLLNNASGQTDFWAVAPQLRLFFPSSTLTLSASWRQDDWESDFGIVTGASDKNYIWTIRAEMDHNLGYALATNLLYGLEYRDYRSNIWYNFLGAPFARTHTSEDITGAYIQLESRLTERLTLDSGLRYDVIATDFKDELTPTASYDQTHRRFNPRIGLSWNLDPAFNLFANYSQGIESVVMIGAMYSNLNPERIQSWEIGCRGKWKGWLDYQLAGYRKTTRDMAVQTGALTYENAGRVEALGTETSLTAHLPHAFHLTFEHTWQHAIFRNYNSTTGNFRDNRVPLVPAHGVGIHAGWENPRFGRFDIAWRWRSRRFADPGNTLKLHDYSVVDLHYAFHFAPKPHAKNPVLTVSVTNLFNRVYADFAERDPLLGNIYAAYPADGRAAQVAFSIDF